MDIRVLSHTAPDTPLLGAQLESLPWNDTSIEWQVPAFSHGKTYHTVELSGAIVDQLDAGRVVLLLNRTGGDGRRDATALRSFLMLTVSSKCIVIETVFNMSL